MSHRFQVVPPLFSRTSFLVIELILTFCSFLQEMDISKQEENFIRVSLMIMNVVASQLRAFFTQAWNSLHGGAVWRNDPASGKRFITEMKKKKGQIKDKTTGKKLKEGNTSKWDCTILFAALLYSNVFTKDPAKDPAFALIDRLRGLRNDWFAHLPMAEMTDVDFCILVEQLKVTFVQLSWDENEITRISKDQLKTDDFKSLETDMQSFIKDKDTLLKELNEEKTLNESLVVKVQELVSLPFQKVFCHQMNSRMRSRLMQFVLRSLHNLICICRS